MIERLSPKRHRRGNDSRRALGQLPSVLLPLERVAGCTEARASSATPRGLPARRPTCSSSPSHTNPHRRKAKGPPATSLAALPYLLSQPFKTRPPTAAAPPSAAPEFPSPAATAKQAPESSQPTRTPWPGPHPPRSSDGRHPRTRTGSGSSIPSYR